MTRIEISFILLLIYIHLKKNLLLASPYHCYQIDRVYLSSPQCVAVLDHEKKRTYVVSKEGLPDIGNLYHLL